ncbi:MAG: hypothetical protein IIB05_08420 [Bacteroidetes bacterium]|nr:hypothetical protein [Bacteroidota bacterium]
MEELFNYNNELLKIINNKFFRFLYSKIDWSQRMIAIKRTAWNRQNNPDAPEDKIRIA